jgi:hypothetical protein
MIAVDVILRGRLLARYFGDDAIADLPHHKRGPAMIALAKQNLLSERLVDEPHLDDLNFEVRDA